MNDETLESRSTSADSSPLMSDARGMSFFGGEVTLPMRRCPDESVTSAVSRYESEAAVRHAIGAMLRRCEAA
ncbi:MAG: hypothetical protein WA742_02660, partial [Candidatus Cybelea sp.]